MNASHKIGCVKTWDSDRILLTAPIGYECPSLINQITDEATNTFVGVHNTTA